VGLLVGEALGWLSVLVLLGGVVVCAMYLGRVSWAGVLLLGFGLQAIGLGLVRFLGFVARHGLFMASRLGFLLAGLALLLGCLALVAGAAGTLSECARLREGTKSR